MICKTFSIAFLFVLFVVRSVGAGSVPSDAEAITAAVDRFHDALRRGDAKTAMELLAPDAVILESGSAETRAEYESHHLPEDIQFAHAVHSNRSDVRVQIEANTAWLTSRSKAEGSFEGKPINSVGVELVVLNKTAEGWRIRAIHWSSHKVKTAE
jgi:ketosteroid isomerase-like protein